MWVTWWMVVVVLHTTSSIHCQIVAVWLWQQSHESSGVVAIAIIAMSARISVATRRIAAVVAIAQMWWQLWQAGGQVAARRIGSSCGSSKKSCQIWNSYDGLGQGMFVLHIVEAVEAMIVIAVSSLHSCTSSRQPGLLAMYVVLVLAMIVMIGGVRWGQVAGGYSHNSCSGNEECSVSFSVTMGPPQNPFSSMIEMIDHEPPFSSTKNYLYYHGEF